MNDGMEQAVAMYMDDEGKEVLAWERFDVEEAFKSGWQQAWNKGAGTFTPTEPQIAPQALETASVMVSRTQYDDIYWLWKTEQARADNLQAELDAANEELHKSELQVKFYREDRDELMRKLMLVTI